MALKNEAQLKKFLIEKCKRAVSNTEEKVYTEFADSLSQFYVEFEPEEYVRTDALMDSLDHTGVKQVGNQHMSRVEAEVGFDTPQYEHGWVQLKSGDYGYSYWSDEQIQDVVMTGKFPHGNHERGTAIWTHSMRKLGGKKGIENLLKQELSEQGLKLKK